jgi:hypothetical protein
MVELGCSIASIPSNWSCIAPQKTKNTDVVELSQLSNHVGLLINEPPGTVELLFI